MAVQAIATGWNLFRANFGRLLHIAAWGKPRFENRQLPRLSADQRKAQTASAALGQSCLSCSLTWCLVENSSS